MKGFVCKFNLRMAFFAVLFMFLVVTSVHAQRYLGGISGGVSDTTGARIPGAQVIATDTSTKFTTKVTADESGGYNMPSLQPSTYSLTVTAAGFKTTNYNNIVVTAGQVQQIDVKMNTGEVSETVEVSDAATLLNTSSPDISTTLNTQEVTNLPNVGRNAFVMATLGPGISYSGFYTAKVSQYTQPFSGVAIQLSSEGNGGHNRLTLDGIVDDPAERFSGAGYTGFVPSPEAIQEVKVQTSIFDAQVGHGNGTVTNSVVRTGTNNPHGALYYAFQNTYLNANNYENVPSGKPRNNDQLAQTGFVFDGPVYIPKVYNGRNKTFFMVAYEFYQSHMAVNYTSRVPTGAERAGDFGDLCPGGFIGGICTSGIQLYDPLTMDPVTHNRTAIANNNIASRINATGSAMVNYMPLPNVPGVSAVSAQKNYISTQTSYRSTYPSFIARFDHAFGQNNKLNVMVFRSGLTQSYPMEGFPQGIGPIGFGYSVLRNNRGGAVDDTHTFSSTMVLNSRFGLIHHPFGLTYPGNANFDMSKISMNGAGLPYKSFPGMSASDSYTGLAPGAGGQVSADTTGSLDEILTKIIGGHSIRVGFDGNVKRYNVQNPQSGMVGSSANTPGFAFDRQFTQKNSVDTQVGADGSSGDPIASMLMGYFSSANYSINIAYALQQIYVAPFVQDDWRVNSKLTLNLGLRWDYESPLTERYNRMVSGFCTTCTNPMQVLVPSKTLKGGLQYISSSNRFPYSRDLNNFQPRIGAAYAVSPNTVVRGGFGIIYFNMLETPLSAGYSATTTYNNTFDQSHPINTMSDPYPSGVTTPSGNRLGLATQLGQNVTFNDPHHVQPKNTQWTASLQQQFPGDLALQVAYVGARPTRLDVNHNINVLPRQYWDQGTAGVAFLNTSVPNPMGGHFSGTTVLNRSTITNSLYLLPYPEFGTVTENYSSIGSAPYHSMQIQLSKPMKNHFSLQGNFTWQKTMRHDGFFNNYAEGLKLYSVQDSGATLMGNVFGVLQLPKFSNRSKWQQLIISDWNLNGVLRAQNGNMISAPSNVDIIGSVTQKNPTYARYFNTCYEDTNGNLVMTANSRTPACDAASPIPAYRQRLAYTTQNNSSYIGVRQRFYPRVDASLFKKFPIHESMNFEIRGEFFNLMNTPIFGAPGTSIGTSTFGAVSLVQTNDPRIGQLTARFNF